MLIHSGSYNVFLYTSQTYLHCVSNYTLRILHYTALHHTTLDTFLTGVKIANVAAGDSFSLALTGVPVCVCARRLVSDVCMCICAFSYDAPQETYTSTHTHTHRYWRIVLLGVRLLWRFGTRHRVYVPCRVQLVIYWHTVGSYGV